MTTERDQAAMREIAREYFTNPEFRAWLEQTTWERNNQAETIQAREDIAYLRNEVNRLRELGNDLARALQREVDLSVGTVSNKPVQAWREYLRSFPTFLPLEIERQAHDDGTHTIRAAGRVVVEHESHAFAEQVALALIGKPEGCCTEARDIARRAIAGR